MISVEDVLWVRYAAPDLDLMEAFLADFGLQVADRTAAALFMRGFGPNPVDHVTIKGEARGIGFAFKAKSLEDLWTLAREFNAVVETRSEPGGGQVVRINDPDGNQIEVVHGQATHQTSLSRPPFFFNPATGRTRYNNTVRTKAQPSQVLRFGHVALHTARFAQMRAFYQDVLGMRVSDSYHIEQPGNTIASFMHCGLGKQFVDHHTIALVGDGRSGFEHSAFEVLDMDDLICGNAFLASRNRWKHSWGIGRHIEGSQLFDYWRDPFGNKVEHWTDGDLVNDDYTAGSVALDPMTCLAQWGPPLPREFME